MQGADYYPDTGLWAILGRLSLILCMLLVLFASFAPPSALPRLFYSYHVEHFAVFYVVALAASAAFVRSDSLRIGIALWLLAFAIEVCRLIQPEHRHSSVQDWFADAAGVVAALVPIALGRFRTRFAPRPAG